MKTGKSRDIIIISLAVLTAAILIVGVWRIFSDNAPGDILNDRDKHPLPEITLEHADLFYTGAVGGPYCWQEGGGEPEICVSVFADPDKLNETVQAAPGDEVGLHFESTAPPRNITAVLKENHNDPTDNGQTLRPSAVTDNSYVLTLDAPEGSYILEVSGTWEQGDYSRIFKVEL